MYRSLLPLVLAILGFHIIRLAVSTPLYEWQISEVVTDFPSTYEIHTSSLRTTLGYALNDNSYYGKVYVTKDGEICPYSDMNLTARRSQNDETLEKSSLRIKEMYVSWLEYFSAIVIYLAGIYIWWFAIWYRRPIWESIGLTGLGVFIFLLLTETVRPFLWSVGPSFGFYGIRDCYHGTITFTISLAKIFYAMPAILFVGILLELGVFSMMLLEIIRVIRGGRAVTN